MSKKKLPGDYIAGFVDGEGHFGLRHNLELKAKRKGQPTYWRWGLDFAVTLNEENKLILEAIRETLGCGIIYPQRFKELQYRVYGFKDLLNKIIPFFNKFPLRAKKKQDFVLWKEAAGILKKYKSNSFFKQIALKTKDRTRLETILKDLHKLHGLTKKGLAKGRPRIHGL